MEPIEEIYQKYALTVYKYVMSRTRDSDLAEEMTQETFYQAIRRIDKFDGSCKISTWLCAIAKHQLMEYYRKNPEHADLEEIHEQSNSAEESFFEGYDRLKIMKAIHYLEESYREVMYLRIFGNLSFKEVGEILEKSENWARVTFYRGKEKLKRK